MHVLRKAILAAACTAGLAAATTPALAQTTLRAVMHSDLKILDPLDHGLYRPQSRIHDL